MSTKKAAAQAALTKFTADFEKRFGARTIRRQRGYRVVSTGSLALDRAMGCGGYVVGRITEIWGPESVAKTTLAVIAAANFQREFPARSVAWINMEKTFDWRWATTHGVDPKRLVLMEPENSEDVADMAKMSIGSGLFSLVVLDSVGGMITEEETEKPAEKDSVGTAAKVVTRMVKIAAVLCDDTETTMIIVNQTRANLGYGGGTTTGGGFALKHVTTHRIKLRRTNKDPYVLGPATDPITVGVELAALVQKNKVAPPGRTATFALFVAPSDQYGPVGIDRVTEAFTIGTRTGVIGTHGSWYELPGVQTKLQGQTAVYGALRAEPGLVEEIRRLTLERVEDEVAVEAPVPVAEEELDFATGALGQDFEPDEQVLARLREQAGAAPEAQRA